MKITRKTQLFKLAENPDNVEILRDVGLHCIGCFASQFETLEQGCKGHGMSDDDINGLIKSLNKINKA